MKIRFLLDENMSPRVIAATLHQDAAIDIIRVGDTDAPPLGTLDPDVLLYCEAERRMLVTGNRKSMPTHLADHYAGGRRHWGILQLRKDFFAGEPAQYLHLYWAASEAEEWINRVEWIP